MNADAWSFYIFVGGPVAPAVLPPVFLKLIWRHKNTGGKTAGATENIGAQLAGCILPDVGMNADASAKTARATRVRTLCSYQYEAPRIPDDNPGSFGHCAAGSRRSGGRKRGAGPERVENGRPAAEVAVKAGPQGPVRVPMRTGERVAVAFA